MAPHLLGAIAVAAYSYMSLVPLIQPPIMTLCTSKADRMIKMDQLRTVSAAYRNQVRTHHFPDCVHHFHFLTVTSGLRPDRHADVREPV